MIMTTKTPSLLLLGLFALLFPGNMVVEACSCLGPLTVESSFESDLNPTALRVLVQSELPRPADAEQNVPRYYQAVSLVPFKNDNADISGLPTCPDAALRQRPIVIRTAANGALCGVELDTTSGRAKYLLFGRLEYEFVEPLGATVPVLRIEQCAAQQRWRDVARADRKYLKRQRACRCGGISACGPSPAYPSVLCADGVTVAGPPTVCEWNKNDATCEWGDPVTCPGGPTPTPPTPTPPTPTPPTPTPPTPTPPTPTPPTPTYTGFCNTDDDCYDEEYCAYGRCLGKGGCFTTRDCNNPSNLYPVIACVGYLTCDASPYGGQAGRCDKTCACSNCPPTWPSWYDWDYCPEPVNCIRDPCTPPIGCDVPGAKCVSNYCGGCKAEWYGPAGEPVCM